ncbi:hypothetical protein SERLADRAFT_434293 [Serpula lacrymans var. lacrymans S7.9]|uniref:Uncharacterized protein n=1 Tax=Serpula lacrymans var. lacrymans (strain S7.9) TaxID=578457 RepID=F8NKB6_SERL9|nr:uncharacterized protein SERLADRAFT_434293 [Serpula lacrymans var. lacrymans S7.9]EGO28382.1 hypothetical protein SERLADRAFT_434293 [Serpula lacrymans var. lacrymans S7.9]
MPGVKDFALQANNYLLIAHDAIIASRVNQTHQANTLRREENTYKVGDLVYLSTEYLSLPKGRAWKLLHKYIGQYNIVRTNAEKFTTSSSSLRSSKMSGYTQYFMLGY